LCLCKDYAEIKEIDEYGTKSNGKLYESRDYVRINGMLMENDE